MKQRGKTRVLDMSLPRLSRPYGRGTKGAVGTSILGQGDDAIQPMHWSLITSFRTQKAVSRSYEISGSGVVRTTSFMRSSALVFQRWPNILQCIDLVARKSRPLVIFTMLVQKRRAIWTGCYPS